MNTSRGAVLDELAARSDAGADRTTTVAALAAALDTDEDTVTDHLEGLRAGELALQRPDGRVRITITGEELLALDLEGPVIVDPTDGSP